MKKRSLATLAAAAILGLGLSAGLASANNTVGADAPKADSAAKTITGKSACATCEGVTSDGHAILLIQPDGSRWVLDGDSASYKAAHEVRKLGKTITATLAGEPISKKDSDGKEYKEVKVSDVKIDA